MWVEPIELRGQHVTLLPLSYDYVDELEEALLDGEIHKLWYTAVPEVGGVRAEIEKRLAWRESGFMQPFVAIDAKSGKAVGMTTFCRIDAANRRVEIGYTWYRKSVQRTALNTEAKFMLLEHAFEQLNAVAVEFRTSQYNFTSQRAITRLGAKLDGVLRSARLYPDCTVCDTHVYSILNSEWGAVRMNLQHKLSCSSYCEV